MYIEKKVLFLFNRRIFLNFVLCWRLLIRFFVKIEVFLLGLCLSWVFWLRMKCQFFWSAEFISLGIFVCVLSSGLFLFRAVLQKVGILLERIEGELGFSVKVLILCWYLQFFLLFCFSLFVCFFGIRLVFQRERKKGKVV